jgi:hypothetical protein
MGGSEKERSVQFQVSSFQPKNIGAKAYSDGGGLRAGKKGESNGEENPAVS